MQRELLRKQQRYYHHTEVLVRSPKEYLDWLSAAAAAASVLENSWVTGTVTFWGHLVAVDSDRWIDQKLPLSLLE